MIMEKVLAAAKPYLAYRTVKDLVIGISLIGCQLDNSNIGISYVLRDALPNGCSAFPYVQMVIGKPASEIAKWVISGDNDLQRAIGTSVLVAVSCEQDMANDNNIAATPFGVEIRSEDKVGMVGMIKSLAIKISKSAKELIIFDKSISPHNSNLPHLYPIEKQSELLPNCDVIFLSGTTTINGSIDDLLKICGNARTVVMVGPSTPMFPTGWKDTCLTHLAGSRWDNKHKDEIFKLISMAGGIKNLQKYMHKKVIAIK